TTRDTIEEVFTLNGIQFRLIDTAGLRESTDHIEKIGVGKTKEHMLNAELLIYLFDISKTTPEQLQIEIAELPQISNTILVANKADTIAHVEKDWPKNTVFISAKNKDISKLTSELERIAGQYEFGNETIVNNARHADALTQSSESLNQVITGIESGITSDLIALDIRNALYQLGLITGEVTNDEVLDSIFTRFCIGK
ncbi:MAG: GTP-binding protein, partial [Bacteroidia bacterium]|nr:GTP-binding protein [Bacteroidia bacterium]